MTLDTLLKQEANQMAQQQATYTQQVHASVEEAVKPSFTHSMPVKRADPVVIQRLLEQEQKDRAVRDEMRALSIVETAPPPSMYSELMGKSMLRETLGLQEDNLKTTYLNDYVIQKMRIGKLQDTRENYDKVLDTLLRKNNIARHQEKGYILNKLYLYLQNGGSDEDEIVLSILKNGRYIKNDRNRKHR